VIGGGDTVSDCVGTSIRQGALSVTQIEILPKPPEGENPATPWPYYPTILKVSSSHMEGCTRRWGLSTLRFNGSEGRVTSVDVVPVEWLRDDSGKMTMRPSGEPETLQADLVLLSMGFLHPVHQGLLQDGGVPLNERGNVRVDDTCKTGLPKVFAAGDSVSGASLVVSSIASGRKAGEAIHQFLSRS